VNPRPAAFVAPRASSPVRPNIEGHVEVAVMGVVVMPLGRRIPVSRIQTWGWSLLVAAAALRAAPPEPGRSC
jgi:hypothetical protein